MVGRSGAALGTPARAVGAEAPRGAGDAHVLPPQGLAQALAGRLS